MAIENNVNSEVDYSKHINVSSPQTEKKTEDQVVLLQRILLELQKTNGHSLTTYNIIYSIDTSLTTKQKIDVFADAGNYATEMSIINNGGGFTININDESIPITSHNGLRVINEKIERLYWTGTGNIGTGKMRFGLVK